MKTAITLNVNGEIHDVLAADNQTLLETLREQLGLTGSKRGCDMGTCGACTVLIDGKPSLSCITLTVRAQNKSIMTIEGLAQNGQLHPLQKAAVQYGAIQCGFCTPGWLMSAKALLDRNSSPTEMDVRRAISGNLCRCTGYVKIVESILAASKGQVA
ncbi:MAG: (2Fe-2S)-binding protein [Candidatus Woesebacteria bacterium]|nr:(2Fe-2S)-binding protein [Candidatus Woesebacteria bacterium]